MTADITSGIEASPDADIQFEKEWWGFYIHMGKEEVDTWQNIKSVIFSLVEPLLGGTLGKVISAAVEVQKLWVQAVADERGVSLVSPWVSPAMLVPIPRKGAPSEDGSLWWCVYDLADKKWGPDQRFPAHYSYSTPALAEYKGNLYCVHRGFGKGGDDTQLWMTTFNPDGESQKKRWSTDTKIPNHWSKCAPGLAVYRDELHCVYRGHGGDSKLYHIIYDGDTWRSNTMEGSRADSGPALAVFDGQLHCAHRGSGSDTQLQHTIYDGQKWTGDKPITTEDSTSEHGPALVVDGYGELLLVYRGVGNDECIYYNRYREKQWRGGARQSDQSAHTPAFLPLSKDDTHLVYRGGGNDDRLWHAARGPAYVMDKKFSAAGPGLIHYKDPYAKRDQILCVHRGHGPRGEGQSVED